MRLPHGFVAKSFFEKNGVVRSCAFSAERVEVAVMALGFTEWKMDVEGLHFGFGIVTHGVRFVEEFAGLESGHLGDHFGGFAREALK